MRKISESMEIATWKAIAYRVQQLNFADGTEQEFQENLGSITFFVGLTIQRKL